MELALARNWWSLVLRGLVGVILGIIAFSWPGITLASIVMLFGAYALVDGIVNLIGAVRAARAHERWGVLILEGIVGIAAAAVTVMWPAITLFTLVFLVMMQPLAGALVVALWFGAYALIFGVVLIALGLRLRSMRERHLTGPA